MSQEQQEPIDEQEVDIEIAEVREEVEIEEVKEERVTEEVFFSVRFKPSVFVMFLSS